MVEHAVAQQERRGIRITPLVQAQPHTVGFDPAAAFGRDGFGVARFGHGKCAAYPRADPPGHLTDGREVVGPKDQEGHCTGRVVGR